MKAAKAALRQGRRIPLPDSPTLTLVVDDLPGHPLLLDRVADDAALARAPQFIRKSFRLYAGHGVRVLMTPSIHAEHGRLLHVSVSVAGGALPSWGLLKAVKQAIFPPDVAAMMVLPADKDYVNLAEVMHLVQCPGPWGPF